MPDFRFFTGPTVRFIVTAVLLSILTACGGPGGLTKPPEPPPDELRTVTGSISLPSGHTVNLASLTVSTPTGTTPVSASGEFTATVFGAAATEIGVETAAGELLLIGVTDAPSGSDTMLVSLTSTAESLLYYLVGGMWLPPEQQDKVRSLLQGAPAATALAEELERQLMTGSNGVADPDAGVLAALEIAHAAILGDTRIAGLAAGAMTSATPTPTNDQHALSGYKLIVTSTDDGSNIIIEPTTEQAGVKVLHNPTGAGVVAQNSYRRPAALLAYEVAWEDADNNKHDLNPPLLVERVEVPSTGQLELLNALIDVVTGDSPWSPVLSPPLALTGHEGASRTHYQLILVGPSTTDASWPIMNNPRFTNFHGDWNDIMIDKSVDLFLDDLLLPLIEVYALGSMAKMDASKLNKMRERVRISHNQHFTKLGVYLTQGQAGYANALKFFMAELIENRTYRLGMLDIVKDVLEESSKNKAAIDAMETRLSSRASASAIATAVQTALVSGDVAKVMYDLASSPKAIDWTVIAAPALFTLTPAQAKVTRNEASAKFTVTPKGQTTGNYIYRWTTSANHGDLSDLLTDGTTITTTSHEIWYFHNRPNNIEDTDRDTITVEIFEVEPGATSIPPGASPIARMTAEVHGDDRIFDPHVISAGSTHSLALSEDGTVWAWGNDVFGELGDGTTRVELNTPVPVLNLTNITSISAGHSYSLALREDGTVWAWGFNYWGQLGDGTTTDRYPPVQVPNLTNITSVNAGGSHSLALDENGTAWAWGDNRYGQLGDGTTTDRLTPVRVPNLTNITSINIGYSYSLALREDGTVWAWGRNSAGQLGDDDLLTNRHTPVQVPNLTNITSINAGNDHSLALSKDGTVWAWGWNGQGLLGDGTTTSKSRPTPLPVLNLTNITSINAGEHHSLALSKDGTVWAWGWNLYGQLGDGTNTRRLTTVQVLNLTNITSINAGGDHSLALQEDGTVWAWGNDWFGQLGDGTNTHQFTPVKVK